MEGQTVIVIQDASREINLRVFEWAIRGLSLMPGDMLTLIAVMHQIITPMGYKSSVDNKLMFGANQKIIEEQAALKKEEILNNEELAQIFKLYKSKKVVFKIEMATGSSPKTVALKSAMKLKATWLILDRKMKNDEEYFLQKLSCGILRIRRFNKIDRIRGPLHLPQETQPGSTHETYLDSIPPPDSSTEPDPDLINIDISPTSKYFNTFFISTHHVFLSLHISPPSASKVIETNKSLMIGHVKDNQMTLKQVLKQESLHDEAECSTSDQLSTEKMERDQLWQSAEQIESRHHGKERDQKLTKMSEEKIRDIADGSNWETNHESLSTEVYQKDERCSQLAGARNFYLGGAEEYSGLTTQKSFAKSHFNPNRVHKMLHFKNQGTILAKEERLLCYNVEELQLNYSPELL
ncbi:hypothetical protein VNO77_29988 [Canavalia gladiata]|uniref:Uncharacterized protein n=1 Tax=Canavalia gladiata TaxID=3824 RepID=A0AAN9Q164_CANGL